MTCEKYLRSTVSHTVCFDKGKFVMVYILDAINWDLFFNTHA